MTIIAASTTQAAIGWLTTDCVAAVDCTLAETFHS
jgi:hypothetical protein